MNKNTIMIFAAGLVGGYLLDKMMAPTAKVGAVSLTCECAAGGRCNSGKNDCSCCKYGTGRLVPFNQAVPIQVRKSVGI